jgi:hypothetical protein
MKNIYCRSLELPTVAGIVRRDFWFDSLKERFDFEKRARAFGARRVGLNITRVMSADEALEAVAAATKGAI